MSDEVHVLDRLGVLYKRRRLAITVFLLIVIGTTVYTMLATPIFQAKVRLLIEAEEPNVVNFKGVIDEQQAKADYYTTQYTILQSRALARKTLESLKLWNTPPFGEASAAGDTSAQSTATDRFLVRVRVVPIRDSRLVDVFYELPDPALATTIVNALARNYIDQNREYRFLAAKDATDWLEDRLAEHRQQVESAERALQKYREQNGAISPADGENIVVQKLSQLNAEVTRAKTERLQQEAMYVQLQRRQADHASLETFGPILTDPYIREEKTALSDLLRRQTELAETYGDKNDQMIAIKSLVEGAQARLDNEIQKVVQSLTTDYQVAVAREKSLVQALEDQKAEALLMNNKAIEYNVLQREVDSSKQIYDSLMQRAKETGVAAALTTSNIRIIDVAEKPRVPVSPNRLVNLLAGVLAGAVLAIGLVFFVEYMDNRLRTPDDITYHLKLPHLGFVPLLPKSQEASGYALTSRSTPATFVDAFRVIRTNMLIASAGAGGQSVLITSAGLGEGRSLVAANLAVSLAQAGKRVLLVDADMRKPTIHRLFDLPQAPGLSDHLAGTARTSDAVHSASVEGLSVLSSGAQPPNPAELLGSPQFTSLLQTWQERFDWVVIDSPPVIAAADASVIAHATTGVLFVVGADMTSRHAARRAVDRLEGTQARFFGAVLNRADLEAHAYHYSQYHRRDDAN